MVDIFVTAFNCEIGSDQRKHSAFTMIVLNCTSKLTLTLGRRYFLLMQNYTAIVNTNMNDL